MEIKWNGDHARVIPIDGGEIEVEPGQTVDVPDEIAVGRPPVGDPDLDLNYDPGTSGLVAQDGWEVVKQKQARKDAPASDDAPQGEEV